MGTEGKTFRVTAKSEAAVRSGGADHQGAELPEVQGGEVQTDKREHQPEGVMVGPSSDWYSAGHGSMADEAPQELFRGQEIGLDHHQYYCIWLGMKFECRECCLPWHLFKFLLEI